MNGRVATLSPVVVVVTSALLGAFTPAYAGSCEDIASRKLLNTTIVSATEVPAGQFSVPNRDRANMQGTPPRREQPRRNCPLSAGSASR